MNVLILSFDPRVSGGTNRQCALVAKGLAAKGHAVLVYGMAPGEMDTKPVKLDGYVVRPAREGGTVTFDATAQEFEPDAVIVFCDPWRAPWFWDHEFPALRGKPIYYWHVWDAGPAPDFLRPIYEKCRLVAISILTDRLVHELGFPCDYIPHGVDTSVFSPGAPLPAGVRAALQGNTDEPMPYAFWNNMAISRKELPTVIEAVALSGLALVINANGPRENDIPALLRKFWPGDRPGVVSYGGIPDEALAGLYGNAAVTVSLSSSEGFGLSGIESLACGTPTVFSDVGGHPDFCNEQALVLGERRLVSTKNVPYCEQFYVAPCDAGLAIDDTLGRFGERGARAVLPPQFRATAVVDAWDALLRGGRVASVT